MSMKIENLMVTGGCGFIGSNFIRYLLEQSDFQGRIINVDTLTYAGNPENLKGVAKTWPGRYAFVRADICDLEAMKKIFAEYGIDGICHFAAESHVDRSIKRPDSFIFSNIIGTFNLLEIARGLGDTFQIFHHISTDEVYGSLGPEGLFTEETPYRPNSPIRPRRRPRTIWFVPIMKPSACPRPCRIVPITTGPISSRRNSFPSWS